MEATGKRFLLAVDVSGSMTSYTVLGSTALDARTASAAMAMVTARTEANYHILGFSNRLVPLNINSKMDLNSVIKVIEKVRLPGFISWGRGSACLALALQIDLQLLGACSRFCHILCYTY